jgi:hypothetical protein
MYSPFIRTVSALLLPLFIVQVTGCRSVKRLPPAKVETHHVTGVAVVDGRRIHFDGPGRVQADTVFGVVDEASFQLPLDSVGTFFVDGRSTRMGRGDSEYSWSSEDVRGVTMITGIEQKFDPPGHLVGDSVKVTMMGTPLSIPLDSIQHLWVRRGSTGKTVLLVVGVLVAIMVVGAAIEESQPDPPPPPEGESCPFVYSWDGEQYVFDAEPFGGAVTRGLERDDYGILERLVVEDGQYRILLTNEVSETQRTNLLELWVVDHPAGIRVVADEWGRLHTLGDPMSPRSAWDQDGRDLVPWLAHTDRLIWESPPRPDSSGALRDEIILTFPKPLGATRAKLVARVGTGLWGSNMIRTMLELRGEQVDEWYASIDDNPAALDSLNGWNIREELYALKVEVEEPSGWRVRGIVPGGGPFATEDRVVTLNLSKVEGDSLRLRLRPPRGFWALNSFAVDYSNNQPIRVDTLAPVRATDPLQGNVLPALLATDEAYYTMPVTGDRADIVFPAAEPVADPDITRTVLLHSRGYYRLHLPPGGAPDTLTLNRLRDEPGAALEFSMQEFARRWLATTSGAN